MSTTSSALELATGPSDYVGRFAPSPTGPLHAGSLVAALASFLDARVAHGRWLVRIEDVDLARSSSTATAAILDTLEALGLTWDGTVTFQSSRGAAYARAFELLRERGLVYPCTCSRREVADSGVPGADGAPVYPGTCRNGPTHPNRPWAWRLRVPDEVVRFTDRRLGPVGQNLARAVGDFVLRRADGIWTYQLAVVVDDALQLVTDVVRGEDLLDSTARQIYLQRCLDLRPVRYLHLPLVTDESGAKLSKQTGAQAIDGKAPLGPLLAAAQVLGLNVGESGSLESFYNAARWAWRARYPFDFRSTPNQDKRSHEFDE